LRISRAVDLVVTWGLRIVVVAQPLATTVLAYLLTVRLERWLAYSNTLSDVALWLPTVLSIYLLIVAAGLIPLAVGTRLGLTASRVTASFAWVLTALLFFLDHVWGVYFSSTPWTEGGGRAFILINSISLLATSAAVATTIATVCSPLRTRRKRLVLVAATPAPLLLLVAAAAAFPWH
jgi:hypothetical protein